MMDKKPNPLAGGLAMCWIPVGWLHGVGSVSGCKAFLKQGSTCVLSTHASDLCAGCKERNARD